MDVQGHQDNAEMMDLMMYCMLVKSLTVRGSGKYFM
jgi:hypothetical protein